MECKTHLRDIMSSPPIAISSTSSLKEAIGLMWKFDVDSVIVIENGRPIGILTQEDAIKCANKYQDKASDLSITQCAIKDIIILKEDNCVKEAWLIATKYGQKYIPIINSRGYLTGVISESDLKKINNNKPVVSTNRKLRKFYIRKHFLKNKAF